MSIGTQKMPSRRYSSVYEGSGQHLPVKHDQTHAHKTLLALQDVQVEEVLQLFIRKVYAELQL